MIRPYVKEGKIPIWGVRPNGEEIYTDKINGHFIWDVDPSMCDSDCDCYYDDPDDDNQDEEVDSSDDEDERPCKPYPPPRRDRDPMEKPWVGIHRQRKPDPDWIHKRGLEILQERNLLPTTSCIKKIISPVMEKIPSPIPCMMFTEADFPPMERKVDVTTKVTTKPHISSSEIGTDGRPKPLSQAEEVLNWQTENARAQNLLLKKIDDKVNKISSTVDKCDERLEVLSERMRKLYHQLTAEISKNEEEWRKLKFGEESNKKEREVRRLKAELYELENYIERKMRERQEERESSLRGSSSYMTSSIHVSPMFLPPPESFFIPPPKPWALPTSTPFRESRRPESSKRTTRRDSPEPLYEDTSVPQHKPSDSGKNVFQDSQDPYEQFTVKIYDAEASSSNNSSDTEDTQSTYHIENIGEQEESDSAETNSEADNESDNPEKILDQAILMANTTDHSETIYDDEDEVISPLPNNSTKPSSGPWFTLDDVPPRQWRRRLIEFGAWLDTKLMRDPDSYKVIEEFCCRMTGTLKEWYHHLGAVRQNQLHEQGSSAAILGILHEEFMGDTGPIDKKIRDEYYTMKCCSLKVKDLDTHFQRMLKRFYLLNGLNDPSLKNTYVASLPDRLQPEINRMAMATQKEFSTMSMGQIHQMTQEALDKLCQQHQYISDVLKEKGEFSKACKKPYLGIKCKEKTCSCSSKKKKSYSFPKKKKKYKFFKKKQKRGKPSDQRCFICGKKGHYSRTCPNKADKAIKLISSLDIDDEDVESIYSEQSTADEETVFALGYSDGDQSDTESIPIFSTTQVQSIVVSPPQPGIEIQLLPSKYQRPIKAIAYMDTGAQKTMMNPDILPKEAWKKEYSYFIAADGEVFITDLISVNPIGICFSPDCIVWSKVIGTKLPDRDILIGMDVFSKAASLQIHSTGIKYKREFKPFSKILKIFSVQEDDGTKEIKNKLLSMCADSHESFPHPNPLWKNEDFFIRLPFKLNEDINPTKATHPGMSPSHLLLAKQECLELLKQGLIEPTQSNWACQAFYVEKRSERLRGKKRLVIDYKPLNHFLQDDKFPIPKASSLPILLRESNIFSKFDLKSGFWRLGIHPEERYKTAFCIPNAQYQWKVLPFGLKVAPSLFQKAMIRIFDPIMENAIIYIDDILIFSKDMDSHKKLLEKFFDIINQHGIMLSERKIYLFKTEIDFLGMHFSQGCYQPQPHIAEELKKFPDHSLTIKQTQQFLGIVNYIRDFIPHVAKYVSPLTRLLKKDPPSWGTEQTRAIQELKKIAQSPPALKIPGEGDRILQTNASDDFWGAKFDFHLRSFRFEVQMDNSSFPKILEFKNKMPPDPQILRLKDWFSRYNFSVKHIKGKNNIIPDMLSRPNKVIQVISSYHTFPLIYMMKSLSNMAKTSKDFPPGLNPKTVEDILEYVETHYFHFIHLTMKYKVTASFMFNPKNPYGGIFELFCNIGWDLCEPTLWAIWCKTIKKTFFSGHYWNGSLLYNGGEMSSGGLSCLKKEEDFQEKNIRSHNIAYSWGTFEEYPLDESYSTQLSMHLREINSFKKSPENTAPDNLNRRLIPASNQGQQQPSSSKTTTEYFISEETGHQEIGHQENAI
ncbi:hypothetical protein CR513_32028, partial [Mucuna pruriens]